MMLPEPTTVRTPAKNPEGGSFYLLDPSFKGAQGGSMTFGGGVAAAASQQSIDMKMAVNMEMQDSDKDHYNAEPIFTVAPLLAQLRYKPVSTDATPFFDVYQRDLERLCRLLSPADVLWDYYLLGPMQVVAYANWLNGLLPEKRPRVLVGVDVYNSHWFNWMSRAKCLLQELEPWLRITTTSFTHKPVIEEQLGVKVQLMPRPLMSRIGQGMPLDADMVATFGALSGGPIVGYFTDATIVKSFDLLHACAAKALENTDIRFAIQVRGGPNDEACEKSLQGLKELATRVPKRIVLFDGPLSNSAYKTAVELVDGIIIAYDPASHFADTPSGTMCEAFAAGTMPLVIEGSSMATELSLFKIAIPRAGQQDEASLTGVLEAFSLGYENWLERHEKQIEEWNEFQSYRNMFNHVFEVAWQ